MAPLRIPKLKGWFWPLTYGVGALALLAVGWFLIPPNAKLWLVVAAIVLAIGTVVVGLMSNQRYHNSLGHRHLFGRKAKVEASTEQYVEPVEEYGPITKALERRAPKPLPGVRSYSVSNPRFREHHNAVTMQRVLVAAILTVLQPVGGSGKSRTLVALLHALKYLGFPGPIGMFEENPNGVTRVMLGLDRNYRVDHNHTEMLKAYAAGKITCVADLLNFMPSTDFGLNALLHSGESMTGNDIDTVMDIMFTYFAITGVDAENGLKPEAMQHLLLRVKKSGVAIVVVTNQIDSHDEARETCEKLEAMGIKFIITVNARHETTREDGLYLAFSLAEEFSAPIRFIRHVSELNTEVLGYWYYLSEAGKEDYGDLAAAYVDMLLRGETRPYPYQNEWSDYLEVKQRRADEASAAAKAQAEAALEAETAARLAAEGRRAIETAKANEARATIVQTPPALARVSVTNEPAAPSPDRHPMAADAGRGRPAPPRREPLRSTEVRTPDDFRLPPVPYDPPTEPIPIIQVSRHGSPSNYHPEPPAKWNETLPPALPDEGILANQDAELVTAGVNGSEAGSSGSRFRIGLGRSRRVSAPTTVADEPKLQSLLEIARDQLHSLGYDLTERDINSYARQILEANKDCNDDGSGTYLVALLTLPEPQLD